LLAEKSLWQIGGPLTFGIGALSRQERVVRWIAWRFSNTPLLIRRWNAVIYPFSAPVEEGDAVFFRISVGLDVSGRTDGVLVVVGGSQRCHTVASTSTGSWAWMAPRLRCVKSHRGAFFTSCKCNAGSVNRTTETVKYTMSSERQTRCASILQD